MRKRLFLCLIVFTVFSGVLKPQAPGYIGKRFQAGYGFYLSPAVFGSTGNMNTIAGHGGNATSGTLAFNTSHEVYAEYAKKKRLSFGLSVRYYKTTFDNWRNCTYAIPEEYSLYTGSYNYGKMNGFYTIYGLNYSLYAKLYFRKYVAPWGRYFLFGPTIRTMMTRYNPDIMNVSISTDYSHTNFIHFTPNIGPSKQTFTSFDIMAGLGNNRILYNRLSLDYGCNLNLFAFISTLIDASGDDWGFRGELMEKDYIKKTTRWRSRGVNRLNAFIKIGYLF